MPHPEEDTWTPALPTGGGFLPEHWYRSDGPLWQDAGITPAVADGDVVGRWEDLTANADHVNQAVVANKPTLQNGAGDLLNGHPVIRFDGTNDYLQGAFTTGGLMAQPNTFFAIAKLDAAAVNDGVARRICYGDNVGVNINMLYIEASLTPDKWAIYANTTLSGNNSDSNWHLWTALFNGVTSQFWFNGISQAGPGNAGVGIPDGLTIAANAAGASCWDGDIVELILYDVNLSDADKNQVGQYLADRYALAYTDI